MLLKSTPTLHGLHHKVLWHGHSSARSFEVQLCFLAVKAADRIHLQHRRAQAHAECGLLQSRSWLFDVVANGRNGLDVDKFDYIQRDAFFTGVRIMSDFGRVLQYSKVCPANMTSVSTSAGSMSGWPSLRQLV